MLIENAKPLLIVWLPVNTPKIISGAVSLLKDLGLKDASLERGSSFINDTVDFVVSRTQENDKVLTHIPIPFYFYERTSNAKDASDDATGFLLDSVSENIDISYPETPTADTPGSTKATVLTVRNTINCNFRVKMNSTIVSVLRFLLKKVLTDKDLARNVRFAFFWNEYVLSYCKMVNYDEEPITGTDLTLLKMKLETFQYDSDEGVQQVAEIKPLSGLVSYFRPL